MPASHARIAARLITTLSYPGIPAHLQAGSNLLDRGRQFLPPDHPTSIARNEPDAGLGPTRADHAPSQAQNEADFALDSNEADFALEPIEANIALGPSSTVPPAIPVPPEADHLPDVPAQLRKEANAACTPTSTGPAEGITEREAEGIVERENEPNRALDPALSARVPEPAPTDRAHPPQQNEPNFAAIPLTTSPPALITVQDHNNSCALIPPTRSGASRRPSHPTAVGGTDRKLRLGPRSKTNPISLATPLCSSASPVPPGSQSPRGSWPEIVMPLPRGVPARFRVFRVAVMRKSPPTGGKMNT